MLVEVPVHLVIYPAATTTVTQGLSWAGPALPVEGPDPSPTMQLHSPPHSLQDTAAALSSTKLWLMGLCLTSQLFLQNLAIKQVGFACGPNLCKKVPTNSPSKSSPPPANKLGDIRATKFSSI